MLSNAEETLTTDDKPATIGALSDRDAASDASSVPITEQTNDSPPGEDMDEDTPPLPIDTDTIEGEAYNGACWKNASEHPSAEPKQSGPKRLPPLPLRDEKVILRPLGGLRLDKWPRPTLATALWTAAGVSPNDRRDLILRTRPGQNLAILSTPSSHVADALLNIQELSISQRTYQVSAYLAAPDDSCKGFVPGLEPGTPSHMLVEEMQASGIQILQARMMGQTYIALVTFEGLRGPRLVRFLGAELRCYPHRPRQPVCKTCLKLGHRADHCPTPDSSSARNQVKRQTTPASQASPQPYKKALLNKLATSAATPDRQQAQAPENTNAKAAPREVSCPRDPPQLAPPQTSPHNMSPSTPLPNTHSDPFPEIARLRRDMEARQAHMHAQLEAAIECTNAKIQAAIESARQESLALRQEIISVIHASEERTHALFAELVSRLDSISAPLPDSKSARPQPPLTGARRSHPYSRPAASSLEDDGDP
ncbi:hypothetical protein HPB49_003506 [Dermacentor silvarum]|uniref:Uncharacterized protein n=1 Tax=Dermacentor silvarum TaxID=543639 RepID=A0ACB8DMP9_DERSI|nr:hypothetical protein HPB49_003506 [Dermacentor silvarum]